MKKEKNSIKNMIINIYSIFYIYIRPFLGIFGLLKLIDSLYYFKLTDSYNYSIVILSCIALIYSFFVMSRYKIKEAKTYKYIMNKIIIELIVYIANDLIMQIGLLNSNIIEYDIDYKNIIISVAYALIFAVINYMIFRSKRGMFDKNYKPKTLSQKRNTSIINNYEELKKLKELLDEEIITKEEFEKEKKNILNK